VSDFSTEWLDLREPADKRSRNRDIADAVAARFALRDAVCVVDLGAGTGANLRALASLLPRQQSWTLVDNNPALLEAAKARLAAWADASAEEGERFHLEKDGRKISVIFSLADLAAGIDPVLKNGPELVTASAFFDLVSEAYIRSLVKAVAVRGAAFYATLTCNGLYRWTPHRPSDNQIAAAFQRHQMRDKGFGPAAGPLAAACLADQFRLHGYLVLEGDSPWRLGRGDRTLIDELVRGHAIAAAEAGGVDEKTIVSWVTVARTAATVGHTDMFAYQA
jgi:SAM-dependent methyltransferase